MTIPAHRIENNIRLSINKFIKDTFETPNSFTGQVNYQDSEFSAIDKDQWISISFLSAGAGRKGETLLQADIFSRAIGKTTGGDRYSVERDRIARLFYEAMHVDSIQIYNFSIPASPVILDKRKILVQNANGTFREPNEDVILDGITDGIARRTLTYRLRLLDDTSDADSYYD